MATLGERSLNLAHLEARKPDTRLANVVIDTPRGSRAKFKFDERHGLFRVGKLLPLGTSFPFNFGFIPSTLGEDGDPVDLLLLLDEPLVVGCVAPVRVIGAIQAEQTEPGKKTVRNDRFLGVIETVYNPPRFRSIEEVPSPLLDEIEEFFVTYNKSEGREFVPVGRIGAKQAETLLNEHIQRAAGE
jgi:inorganic pyrophosphatase